MATPGGRFLAGLLALTLAAAACGNSGDDDDDAGATTTSGGGVTTTAGEEPAEGEFVPLEGVPGVTDAAIQYAAFGTSAASAPNATCSLDCYVDGIEAYFAYRNDQGGVHGRQLELTTVLDDELGNNQARATELLSADNAFGIFGYALIPAGFAAIAEQGVPLYTSPVQTDATNGHESSFAVPGGANCIDCPSPTIMFLAQEVGATTIASLGYGVSQASKDCVAGHRASVERFGDDLGIELGYANDALPYGLPNGIAPEVTAMQEAGVDLVFTCLDGGAVQALAEELRRQGMDDVAISLPGEGYGNADFLSQSGDLFEGDVMTIVYRPDEATPNEAIDAFNEYIERIDAGTDRFYALWGWIAADLAYQGLVAAGPRFDRASVIAATNAMTEYTADGLMPPVDWTRQHTAPTPEDPSNAADPQCLAAVRIVGGAYQLLAEPDAPWPCWEPGLETYTDPEFRDFG